MSTSELIFGCMLLYQMRVIERVYGSRKFGVSPLGSRTMTHNPKAIYHFRDCVIQLVGNSGFALCQIGFPIQDSNQWRTVRFVLRYILT